MRVFELLFGRPLRSDEEEVEQVGTFSGIPVLGLDALASASYGPEAAMTALLVLGAAASGYLPPLVLVIIAVLLAAFASYRQTIPAYPHGGGSFTVAKENLGTTAGLVAAAALTVDYVLNVAVAISAGVGAIVSAVPRLLPYTVPLCLGLLALLTLINLRGVRSAGLALILPTYLFVGCLGLVIALGLIETVAAGGAPAPVAPPPRPDAAVGVASAWLLVHAFASGCTALTGIEAVSNAVPIFRPPTIRRAMRTLAALVAILALLLAGFAVLVWAYGVTATAPGQAGYQSVVSQLVGAVTGRGAFYYVTMTAVLAVLALSANTSFADFPRVLRALAQDEFLPSGFAHRGRRLVFGEGIVLLAVLAGALLVAFGGITDRLIPLFAIGAFGAFTMSQLGMVVHWKRTGGPHHRKKLALNAIGAAATGLTLIVIAVAKLTEGAWLVVVVIPLLVAVFRHYCRQYDDMERATHADGPVALDGVVEPIAVVPIRRLGQVGRKALRVATALTSDVRVLQVLAEQMRTDDLTAVWPDLVEAPAHALGRPAPRLVLLFSPFREFFGPVLDYLRRLGDENPGRMIAVVLPERVERGWSHFVARRRATILKGLLLLKGGPQIAIVNVPWYPHAEAATPPATASPTTSPITSEADPRSP